MAIRLSLLAFCLLSLPLWAAPVVDRPRLVLIIDDVGSSLEKGRAALALPGPITYAILPFRTYSRELSQEASAQGKEVILHAPMANTRQLELGPGGLTPAQTREQLQQQLSDSLDAVPEAIGVNNHMGSLLTQLDEPMGWVMEVIHKRGLFFIDSRTTASTRAMSIAQAAGVPSAERNVFLDNDRSIEAITGEFRRAVELALNEGRAVVIGHPYPETLAVLQTLLPTLGELGIVQMSAAAYLDEIEDAKRRVIARQSAASH
ncbi:divergent polysaccharide deacetylase family protein [Marinobacterium sp. YM272]|uniref:divergent polysaccharide deacetylase family protein n=1 Tax=Marinobacterium sp. YM272 TaxID=3421654 RepID=UPI003D7FB650